MLELFMAFNF